MCPEFKIKNNTIYLHHVFLNSTDGGVTYIVTFFTVLCKNASSSKAFHTISKVIVYILTCRNIETV